MNAISRHDAAAGGSIIEGRTIKCDHSTMNVAPFIEATRQREEVLQKHQDALEEEDEDDPKSGLLDPVFSVRDIVDSSSRGTLRTRSGSHGPNCSTYSVSWRSP
jgi:hypothetical protein